MSKKPITDENSSHTRSFFGGITFHSCFLNANLNAKYEKYLQQKRLREAQKRVTQLPDEPGSYFSLAWYLAEDNQLQDAIATWQKGLLLLPFDDDIEVEADGTRQAQMNAWSHDVFGDILLKGGVLKQAREEWEKASALDKYGIGDAARRKLKEHPDVSKE